MPTINGTAGNDTLDGTADGDEINGLGGNDTISGGDGDDTIDGGDGDDAMDGGAGDNQMSGGSGDDSIYGGDGNETIYGDAGNDMISAGYGNNIIYGGDDNDHIEAFDGNDFIDGGAGNDTLIGGGGDDTIYTGAGGGAYPRNEVLDGAGNDTVYGGDDQDSIYGMPGNDYYDGGAGEDSVTFNHSEVLAGIVVDMRLATDQVRSSGVGDAANIGVDTLVNIEHITGSGYADVMTAGSIGMSFQGNSGDDTLTGGEGDDTLGGGDGSDTIDGGDGNDTLYSHDISLPWSRPLGNNTEWVEPALDTGSEADTLSGGAGDDRIFAGYGDNVDGGTEGWWGDTLFISFQGATSGVTVDFRELADDGSITIGGGTIQDIETVGWIEGSEFDDTITGSATALDPFNDYGPIFGRGGNDHLIAGPHTGNIYGGDGNDTIEVHQNYFGGPGAWGAFYGEAGDDIITVTGDGNGYPYSSAFGGDGNDTITLAGSASGGAGNDLINASAGAENGINANGDSGDDTLNGNDQADVLYGGSGADTLSGNGGSDSLYSAGDGGYTWDGYLIEQDTGAEHDILFGGDGDDRLSIGYGDDADGGTGTNTLALSLIGATSGVTLNVADLTSGSPYVIGGGTIQNIQNVTHLWGSNYADTLTLTGAVVVYGMGGNDTINGTDQADEIHGGTGADTINAGDGDDQIYFDGAGETAAGEQINGGAGTDTLVATVVPGTPDDQQLISLQGVTLTGIETLKTMFGAQLGITATQIAAVDTFDGMFFFEAGGAVSLAGKNGINASFNLNAAGNQLDLTGFNSGGFLIIGGSDSADTVIGSALSDNIYANGGNDEIHGAAGNDTIEGGDGNDILDGGADADNMEGGLGDDIFYVDSLSDSVFENEGEGTDSVFSSVNFFMAEGLENLTLTGTAVSGGGNSSNNSITGNGVGNSLTGGAGNDTLYGNAGNDSLFGNSGNDSLSGGVGNDTLSGSTGDDLLDGGDDIDTATYAPASAGVSVNLALAGPQNTVGGGIDTLISIENLIGSGFADTLRGNAGNNSLSGGNGDDRLLGGAGNDTLIGGAGYDRMYGGTGDDTYTVSDATDFAYEDEGEGTDLVNATINHQLRANVENLTLGGTANLIGEGNELGNVITGNSGANKLYGYDGDDSLIGQGGDDHLLGGSGNDTLNGGTGYDRMYGGTGDDTYIVNDTTDYAYEDASEGTDRVIASINHTLRDNVEQLELAGSSDLRGYGNAENNLILGNSGANLLYGRDGDDSLDGGAGNDIVYGENGDDALDGGAGQDRFYGGTGADDFIFSDGDFAGMTSGTADRIHDFSQAEGDQISLAGVDADVGLGGDQSFNFIGSGAFTGHAGELRTYQASGNTYVVGDTNGDGVADFMIRVDGLHSLQASDFII